MEWFIIGVVGLIIIAKVLGAALKWHEIITAPAELLSPIMATYPPGPAQVTKVKSVPTMSRYATPAEREVIGRELLESLAQERAARIEARVMVEVTRGRVDGDNEWA